MLVEIDPGSVMIRFITGWDPDVTGQYLGSIEVIVEASGRKDVVFVHVYKNMPPGFSRLRHDLAIRGYAEWRTGTDCLLRDEAIRLARGPGDTTVRHLITEKLGVHL